MYIEPMTLALISLLALAGLWVLVMMRVWMLGLLIAGAYIFLNYF